VEESDGSHSCEMNGKNLRISNIEGLIDKLVKMIDIIMKENRFGSDWIGLD
jgi:hypothetical protein